MTQPKVVQCPDCGKGMRKAGAGISGRKEYQRYQCKDNKCLRTWLNTKEPFERNK